MGKRNTKKLSLNLTVALSLVLAAILPVFTPSYASAAIQNKSAQQDRTILHALYRCLSPGKDPGIKDISIDSLIANSTPISTSIQAGTFNDDDMSGMTADNVFSGDAAVGYEIDTSDGNASCDGISLTRAMRPIGKDSKWFFTQIYDINHPINRSGTNLYPVFPGMTLAKLLGKIRNLMSSKDLGIGEPEKQRRLATAFWICAEPASNPPSGQTTTYGGKDYQLRSNAPDQVSVGYDMESDNGKFKCSTLMAWGDKNEMAQALNDNPQGSTDGSPGGAGGDDETQSCTGEGLSLGWILCPVVEAVSNFGNYVFSNYIQPMMEQNPLSLKPDDPFYKSWQGFRFLGNVLLIGSLLAIVYSQTRGGGG